MKSKFLLAGLLALMCAVPMSAQISKGDPTATTIKTGNRPVKGDFGVFFGAGIMINTRAPYALPVLDFKYFATDHFELRAGLDVFHRTGSTKGKKYNSATDVWLEDPALSEALEKTVDGFFYLTPGFVYHFSNNNILDVYVGAELPIGFENWRTTSLDTSVTPNTKTVKTEMPFSLGLNALIGMQAFIGNLPLALGIEYGIGAKAFLGNKVKVTQTRENETAVYYQTTHDGTGSTFSRLDRNNGFIDNTIRLTISYYFN